MPKYKVNSRGFYQGRLYDPEGKRSFIFTDKPFNPVPSWVEPIKSETLAEKKKRLAKEKKLSEAEKKKAAEDQKEIENLNFMGDGEKSSAVETL